MLYSIQHLSRRRAEIFTINGAQIEGDHGQNVNPVRCIKLCTQGSFYRAIQTLTLAIFLRGVSVDCHVCRP